MVFLTMYKLELENYDGLSDPQKMYHKKVLGKGSKKKKKNLEFSRFGLTHPPTLVIAENLEKKIKFLLF